MSVKVHMPKLWNKKMQQMMHDRKWKDVVLLFEKHECKMDYYGQMLFLDACMKINYTDKAIEWINKMDWNDIKKYDIQLINKIINFYGKVGDMDKCCRVFYRIPDSMKTVVTLNTMMKCLIADKKCDRAIQLYKIYGNIYGNETSHLLAIKACMDSGNFDEGKSIIQGINIDNCGIKLITILIQFCGLTGDISKAIQIYNSHKDLKDDTLCVSMLINVLVKHKQYNEAINIVNSLNISENSVYGLPFSTILVEVYGHVGDMTKVEQIYNGHCGHTKTDIFYLTVLKACINNKEYELGSKIIDECFNESIIDEYSIQFITVIIEFCASKGDIHVALKLFENINNDKMDIKCVSVLMKWLLYFDYSEKLMEIYDNVNVKHNNVTKLLYLQACMNGNNIEKGTDFIKTINIKNINKYNTEFVTTLMDFYGRSNNIQKVLDLYYQFNKCSDITKLVVIKAFQNCNEWDKGNEFIKTLDISDPSKHNIALINTIIMFYGKSNKIEKSIQLFEAINSDDRNNDCISAMMKCYMDNNQSENAISIYENNVKDVNEVTSLLYIKSCINISDFEKGKEFIDSLNINDINTYSNEFITSVIDFYGNYGDINAAVNIFNQINSSKRNLSFYSTIMKAYKLNNEFEKALDIYDDAHDRGFTLNDYVYSIALQCCGEIISLEKGNLIIASIKNSDTKLFNSVYIQSSLIQMYSKCSQMEKAIQIFNDGIQKNKYSDTNLMILYSSMMDYYAKKR